MNKTFAMNLFLKPLCLEAIKRCPYLAYYFLTFTCEKDFDFIYNKIINLIQNIRRDTFDLSEYEEMFQRAKDCNYEDRTIGVI